LVLERDVKLLTNPVFVRMAVVLLSAVAAFVLGAVAIRMLRHGLVEDSAIPDGSAGEPALPMQALTVIQQLKQQKFALQSEQNQERRRAKTSEQVTAAILANLPCGMLFVAPNGLVRQANAAARHILGFASPLGMSIADLFRDAKLALEPTSLLAGAFEGALQGQLGLNHFCGRYFTPDDRERSLNFTLIPIHGTSGEMLGLAIAITDDSGNAELRQAQFVRGEISAEMALELRTSLSAIREWTQRINVTADSANTRHLATDIATETDRIEKVVGGFLTENQKTRAAEA
jgi:PAS domain-containing protein